MGTVLDTADKALARVSAAAMVDEGVKRRLAADPHPLLAEFGFELPSGTQVKIVESAEEVPTGPEPHTLYLVIPDAGDLSEEDQDLSLAVVAAASCQSTASTACTTPSCVSTSSTASTNSCQ